MKTDHRRHTGMKLIVAAIYTNFETSVVDDTGIEQADAYVAGPVGKKPLLRISPILLSERVEI